MAGACDGALQRYLGSQRGASSVNADVMRASGTLVCLDAPPGSDLGVDLKSWRLGHKFQGVKLLPPGVRFLHYKVGGEQAFTSGMFVEFREAQVHALRWDPCSEDYAQVEPADVERITRAVFNLELDPNLGPYDVSDFTRWHALTSHIDCVVLDRCGIKMGHVISSALSEQDQQVPPAESNGVTYCHPKFTVLPNLMKLAKDYRASKRDANQETQQQDLSAFFYHQDGTMLTPQQITQLQLDPSPLLERLFESVYNSNMSLLLGELELSFVLFIYLASLDGLEFWKGLVQLVCASQSLGHYDNESFCLGAFCDLLCAQITLMPLDLFTDELLQDNFLVESLGTLLSTSFEDEGASQSVRALCQMIKERFGSGVLHRILSSVEMAEADLDTQAFLTANHVFVQTSGSQEKQEENLDSCGDLTDNDHDERLAPQPPAPLNQQRMEWMLPPPPHSLNK